MADYIKRIRTEAGDLQIDYESLANLPVSDTTLTQSGKFADAKAVGDRIADVSNNIADSILDTITPEDIGALPNTYTPPVTSVNGQIGAVNVNRFYDNVYVANRNNEDWPGIDLYNESDGYVGSIAMNINDTANGYRRIGVINNSGNGFDGFYSSVFPPPYPVTSVNGQTGAVSLATDDHVHNDYVTKTSFSLSGTNLTITIT